MTVNIITKYGAIHFLESVIDFDKCWIYKGPAYFKDGYPIIKRLYKNWIASRFSWFIFTGRDYRRYDVHHKCRNKLCINPFHLEELTRKRHARYHNQHG